MQSVWSEVSRKSEQYVFTLSVVCIARIQFSHVIDLTEPIDVYSKWIDEAENAQKEILGTRRSFASSSRVPAELSDDE